MDGMASQITGVSIVYSKEQIKENIKALRHWPAWGEFTGDRSIPRTKGQLRGKCFRLMTLSWEKGPQSAISLWKVGDKKCLADGDIVSSVPITGGLPHKGN